MTAIVSVIRLHDLSTVSPLLWVGMLVTVAGVVTVAMNTPHGHGPAKPKADAAETAAGSPPNAGTQAVVGDISKDPGEA